MAGDADSDSNIKQSPDSSAGDNVERAEAGDASSRESAESSDARSNLSNEAVREFESSSRAGNSSVAAESQARQDTASEHLPSITLEDKQSQANQATSERQAQRETSDQSGQSTVSPSAEQQQQQAQSGDRQTQRDVTAAESGRQSTGEAQTTTGDQQAPQGVQQAQSGDQQSQRDATAVETGRQTTGDQQAQAPEQQAQTREQQAQSGDQQVQDQQQRQAPDQQSRDGNQQTQARDQQAPTNGQQTEFNVQQAQHESAHDREQQFDDQQNQSEQQQDQRESDGGNQTEQKPESTDTLPEIDSWDFNGNNSNQEHDQRQQQNEEQSPASDKLPETDSWDFGNTNNENQDQQQRDDQPTDKLPEVDDWNFGNTNNENQDQQQRDDQPTDNLPQVDDWNFGDQPNHNEAPVNTQNENNRTQEHDGDTTQIPNTESGGPNTELDVPNHEGAGNQQGSLNEGTQNNFNGSANNVSGNAEAARSDSGTVERSESVERQASSENADTRSLAANTDSASNMQNRVAEPVAQNSENASKSESPVSAVGQNQDTLERSTVSGGNNIQSLPAADSKSPLSDSENSLAARTAIEPAQVDGSVAQNSPKEVEKQDQSGSNPVTAAAAVSEKGDSNLPATPQPDGDDSPSPTAKDSKPESQERGRLPANQGFVQPAFVASAANPAATQARVDAQLANMPIRPLTSGFLEKASSDRAALNAMALNSKSFPGKFPGEQSKIGKDGKPVRSDRKSFEGNRGLDGRQGPFDPRFAGISKVEGKAARILKRRLSTSGEKHYLTGIEIALAAAITAAAIAKKRNGVSDEQAASEIAESQLAELLGDLNADSTKKNMQDSAMYRSAVNHFKRPTHLVQPNESLISISEDYFGDSDIAWLIADINAGLINEHFEDGRRICELNSRVEIELPLPSEITDFFARKQKEQRGESIITIIKESEVDSELLNSFLGNVVGIGSGANSPVLEPVALGQLTSTARMAAVSAAPVSLNTVLNSGEKLNTFVSQFGLPMLSVDKD